MPTTTGATPKHTKPGRKHNPSGAETHTAARWDRASACERSVSRASAAMSAATTASALPVRAARRADRATSAVSECCKAGSQAETGSVPQDSRSATSRKVDAASRSNSSATTRTATGTGNPLRMATENRSHPAALRSGSGCFALARRASHFGMPRSHRKAGFCIQERSVKAHHRPGLPATSRLFTPAEDGSRTSARANNKHTNGFTVAPPNPSA